MHFSKEIDRNVCTENHSQVFFFWTRRETFFSTRCLLWGTRLPACLEHFVQMSPFLKLVSNLHLLCTERHLRSMYARAYDNLRLRPHAITVDKTNPLLFPPIYLSLRDNSAQRFHPQTCFHPTDTGTHTHTSKRKDDSWLNSWYVSLCIVYRWNSRIVCQKERNQIRGNLTSAFNLSCQSWWPIVPTKCANLNS